MVALGSVEAMVFTCALSVAYQIISSLLTTSVMCYYVPGRVCLTVTQETLFSSKFDRTGHSHKRNIPSTFLEAALGSRGEC